MSFIFGNKEYNVKIWNYERLGSFIALDTETTIAPFFMTPDLVTCQAYDGGDNVYYIRQSDLLLFINIHFKSTLIMHNAPFDLDVIAKHLDNRNISYDLIDRDKVHDTSILYRLLHLAAKGFVPKKYNLNILSIDYLGEALDKDGMERTTFSQFANCKIEEIPENYLEYGAKDAVATYHAYWSIRSLISEYDKHNTLLSHHIQIKGALALLHIHKNGIGFDLGSRDEWLSDIDRQMTQEQEILATYGWVRGLKGLKDRYEMIMQQLGLASYLPKTDDGYTSSKAEDLEPYRDNPFVASYLKYLELEKASSFVRNIETSRIHPRYNLLMNTGRTSCTSPNVQQLPRVGGIREMFIPKKDHVLIDIDYSSIELSTLAQVTYSMFGESKMRDLINEGKCLHYHTASSVYEKPESEITKDERQFAKIPNFGYGSNMSHVTFIDYARGYGINIDEDFSFNVKQKWADTYPEMKKYWNVGNNKDHYTLTGRRRADCTYTAFLNTGFQGLAADGLKLALYEVDKQGYKVVAEVHDQLVVEHPRSTAENALQQISDIMISEMKKVVPDVKVSVEGQILDKWCK